MGTWHTSIKAVPGIGVFDSAEFTPPDPDWVKPATIEFSGINRCRWCNIGWGGETVDNPMSGPEIPWTNVELFSIDATNPTVLCGICFGDDPFGGDPILVIKVYRGSTLVDYGYFGQHGDAYVVKCSFFRREYSDPQTYTETRIIDPNFVYEFKMLKPGGGDYYRIQNYLEFFHEGDGWYFGISSTGEFAMNRFGNYSLQYPTDASVEQYIGTDVPVPIDPTSPEFGPAAKPKGGYNEKSHKKGTFDDHSDTIAPTSLPTQGVSSSGFINVYRCNKEALAKLGELMFPVPQSLTDIVELVRTRYDMDYVIGCKLVPLMPTGQLVSTGVIQVGFHSFRCDVSPAGVYRVTSDYVEVDLGSIGWSEYWANFLDYAGTSAQLFLPFLGFVPIEPEFWNGGGLIHLIFRMNCITGDFVYLIRSSSGMSELENSLIAQYGGNCSVEIPITGVQAGTAALNLGLGIAQIGNGAANNNFNNAASGVQRLCGLRPDVPKSGGLSAAAGFFGHRRPFLLIKRQDSQFSEKYPEEVGLPLYSMKRLGDCTGLTIAKDAHLDTIPADVEVKAKINQLLAEGVIL